MKFYKALTNVLDKSCKLALSIIVATVLTDVFLKTTDIVWEKHWQNPQNTWEAGTFQKLIHKSSFGLKEMGHLIFRYLTSYKMKCNQTDFLTGQISDKPMTYCISFRPKCDSSVFEVFCCLKYLGDFANFISHIISILQKCGWLTMATL